MARFTIENSEASDEHLSMSLRKHGLNFEIVSMKYLNDFGMEIEEAEIDNNSGDPSKMLSGVRIELECEADLAKIEEVISECSNEYGINLEIVE